MKINIIKLQIAMADKCFDTKDLLLTANLPRSTYDNIIRGRNVRPSTVGKVARALGIDVKDIIDIAQTEEATSEP